MQGGWPDEQSARRDLVQTAREIWTRGLGAAGDGNLSVRVGRDRVIATPGSCHKGRLTERDLVAVDMQGRVRGKGRPSSELLLHLEAYRRRPSIHAVIHAHPPMAIAFNLAGGKLSDLFVSEVIFAFGQVATAPYTTPTTADVPATLGSYLDCYDAILMQRHGSVTLGATLEQAFLRLDAMEHTARIASAARMMGSPTTLPVAEVERLYAVAHGSQQPAYRQPDHACPPLEPGSKGSACGGSCGGNCGGSCGGSCGGNCGGNCGGSCGHGSSAASSGGAVDERLVQAVLAALRGSGG